MKFIGPVLLIAAFSFFGFLIWLSQRLSKEEKGFIAFVQDEARGRNLRREDMPKFVFENFERCHLLYSMQVEGLVLNDIPRMRKIIVSSYKEKP